MSPAQEPGWLLGMRRRAEKEVARIGLPTRDHEDWKHLDVRELMPDTTAVPFHERSALAAEFEAPEAWAVAVFSGGIFQPELSRLPEPTREWSIEPLTSAIDARTADVKARLGHADPTEHALMQLNLERWTDGLFVRVAEGVELPGPVQILDIGSGSSWLRHVLMPAPGARLSVLETHVSPDGVSTASHTVTESVLPAGARLEHVRVQRGSAQARSWNALAVRLEQDSRLDARHFALGSTLSRDEIHADLAAPGAHLEISGLSAVSGSDFADVLTSVRHLARDCVSNQTWKSLANHRARANFVGNLLVDHGADGTQAHQQSRNILLAREATVHSRPQLKIWADDVKCSHGSATGRLDAKALFFLRSRGLSEQDAKRVLVKAFAEEVVGTVSWESVREDLERLVEGRIG